MPIPPAPEPPDPSAGHSARPNGWAWLGSPAIIFMLLAFIAPLAYVIWQSFSDPSPTNYQDAVDSELFRRALRLTFEMAAVVTVLCLLLAYPFAYVMARGSALIRNVLFVSVMISFWTSFLVRTFSWQVLLGNSGVVNDLLEKIGFTDEPVQMLHTTFAVDLAMVHILAPFVILSIYSQIRTIPIELELAAQSMGARPSVAFWRVTFPLTLPGAFAGAVLVFIMAIGFYITPQVLGDSGKSYLGQVIVLQVEKFNAFGTAGAMAVVLLLIVIALLGVAARIVGVNRMLGIGAGGERR